MKYLFLLAICLFQVSAFAEDVFFVSKAKCVKSGGKALEDKKYLMCDGGKYDGFVIGEETRTDCNERISVAKSLLDKDNQVADGDEARFVLVSEIAVDTCARKAKGWKSLSDTLKNAKKACDEGADQSSGAFQGKCYLKAAQLSNYIQDQLEF